MTLHLTLRRRHTLQATMARLRWLASGVRGAECLDCPGPSRWFACSYIGSYFRCRNRFTFGSARIHGLQRCEGMQGERQRLYLFRGKAPQIRGASRRGTSATRILGQHIRQCGSWRREEENVSSIWQLPVLVFFCIKCNPAYLHAYSVHRP